MKLEIDVSEVKHYATKHIKCPEDVYNYVDDLKKASREVLAVLLLDSKNGILDYHIHSVGSIDNATVYPREIIKKAILTDATGIIIVHNHPSSDPMPSIADKKVTKDLLLLCHLLDMRLLDHIIISNTSYFSFAKEGLIEDFETDIPFFQK